MLFHPAVMALLLADALSLVLLLPAGVFAVRLLRHWDLKSGSARQINLERQTYLIATVLGFVFLVQILSLLLLVFTADRLAVQFVGAMCAVGTFNVNPFGFPALFLKLALFFLAATWLFMDHVDNRAPDYPLTRVKYALLLVVLPVAILAALVQLRYFLDLRADVITSCCGSLFTGSKTVTAELAQMPPLPAMIGFYVAAGAVVLAGLHYLWHRRGALVFSGLSAVAFPVAIAAVIAFLSLYIYEHPHHHCPFCLLKAEYGYVGYLVYLPLFVGSALGMALGVTLPFAARAATLRPVMERVVPGVVATATGLFFLLIVLVAWFSWRSNLVLL